MSVIPFALAPIELALDTRLNASDYRVLLGLLTFAQKETRECFPKRETLAARLGLSVTRVSEVLSRLVDLGWVRIKRTGRASTYSITLPALDLPEPAKVIPPAPLPDAPKATPEAVAAPAAGFTSDVNPGPDIGSITDYVSHQAPSAPPRPAPETAPVALHIAQTPDQPVSRPSASTVTPRSAAADDRHQEHREGSETRRTRADRADISEGRRNAVQRVLDAFKRVCGVDYPQGGAIARRINERLDHYSDSELVGIIEAKGPVFRHPAALLKPELVESIGAELKRTQEPAPEPQATAAEPTASHRPERRWFGIPESVIVKHAQPGEDFETAALRLYNAHMEQRRAGRQARAR